MPAFRFEGYVIVSADGMLANADNVMPDALKFEGDKKFFTAALDRADLIVHGRHSGEGQPNSPNRRRIILTSRVAALARDPANSNGTLWNPSSATFEQAADFSGVYGGTVAIIGGPAVFDLFMDRYETFWLSQAPHVRIASGKGCFPGVPARTPQQILGSHGLEPGRSQTLDPAAEVTVTPWLRYTSP